MKHISILLLLFPSALNAMNGTPSSEEPKPIVVEITPIFRHARADQGHRTMDFGYCHYNGKRPGPKDGTIVNDNDLLDDKKTILTTESSNPDRFDPAIFLNSLRWICSPRRIGYAVRGKKLIIQETIPNDETKQFTVLFSLKNYKSDSWHQGAVIEQYGQQKIPLGDAANGVQYLLNIPASNPDSDGSITQEDSSEKADLGDGQKLLAIIASSNEASVSETVTARLNLGLLVFVLGVLATSSK